MQFLPCNGINLAEWCPPQFSDMENRFVSNELGHLAEKISKQNVEGVNWFVLPIYSTTLSGKR